MEQRSLNEYLKQIDSAIAGHEYGRAVTLSYTCYEGFLGAFVRAIETRDFYPTEIITLAREVKDYLKSTIKEYPDEVLNSVTQAAYAIDRSRNRFSESHFASEAGSWLATDARDVLYSEAALLLGEIHWMILRATHAMDEQRWEEIPAGFAKQYKDNEFGKEVGLDEIHWWIFRQEKHVDELVSRSAKALKADHTLQMAATRLRRTVPETYEQVLEGLRKFADGGNRDPPRIRYMA